MMSPDPPRESREQDANNTNDDELVPAAGEFIAVWDDDDDIMGFPDGPYELDIGGGGSESDFTSDEEDDHHQRQPSEPQDNLQEAETEGASSEQGTRTRGHYQLLIPFPTSEIVDDSSDVTYTFNNSHNQNTGSIDDAQAVEERNDDGHEKENYDESVSNLNACPTSSNQEQDVNKRDISLTEEKVEVIKTVMQNFTLPSDAVPTWASELSEDAWKRRLFEKIESKSHHNKNHKKD